MNMNKKLENVGLYRSEFEKDACGIGFVANLKGVAAHSIVKDALQMLENMEHRGGCGCEENTGDGAGDLIKIPDGFYREEASKIGINLPEFGHYGTGIIFFPNNKRIVEICKEEIFKAAEKDLSS